MEPETHEDRAIENVQSDSRTKVNMFPGEQLTNVVTAPWCQSSILRKTVSISSVIEREPRPVSVIEIKLGVVLQVKSARVPDLFRELGIETDFVIAHSPVLKR